MDCCSLVGQLFKVISVMHVAVSLFVANREFYQFMNKAKPEMRAASTHLPAPQSCTFGGKSLVITNVAVFVRVSRESQTWLKH